MIPKLKAYDYSEHLDVTTPSEVSLDTLISLKAHKEGMLTLLCWNWDIVDTFADPRCSVTNQCARGGVSCKLSCGQNACHHSPGSFWADCCLRSLVMMIPHMTTLKILMSTLYETRKDGMLTLLCWEWDADSIFAYLLVPLRIGVPRRSQLQAVLLTECFSSFSRFVLSRLLPAFPLLWWYHMTTLNILMSAFYLKYLRYFQISPNLQICNVNPPLYPVLMGPRLVA